MATGFFITEIGIDRAARTLAKWAKFAPMVTAQAMHTSAEMILVPGIRAEIRKNRSIFRGQLSQKVDVRAIVVGGNPGVEVGSLGVPYGEAVEKGTKPHSADMSKLVQYAQKKMGATGDRAISLAAAIHATIEEEGTKPHPFIIPAWVALKDLYYRDTVRRLRTLFLGLASV